MASDTEIANLALSHLGISKTISSLDTDRTEERNACSRFLDTTREIILSDFAWPFATKIADLALVESDPNDDWAFSYRYPSDCLMLRRILSGIRTDARDTRIPYKIAQDSSGLLVFSDQDSAQVEYTVRVSDPTTYPSDFKMAFSFLLAVYIAPVLTAGDPFKLGDRAAKMYQAHINNAQATAANEEQPDMEPDSEFIRARNGFEERLISPINNPF